MIFFFTSDAYSLSVCVYDFDKLAGFLLTYIFNVHLPNPGEADILKLLVFQLLLAVEFGLQIELLEVIQLQGLEIKTMRERVVANVHLSTSSQEKGFSLLRQGFVVQLEILKKKEWNHLIILAELLTS